MKRWGVRWLLVVILFAASAAGCFRTQVRAMPPKCPPPTMAMIDELIEMIEQQEYPRVRTWIAEMDRYCVSVLAMRKP